MIVMYASSLSLVEICNGAGAALLLLLASEYIFLLLFTVKDLASLGISF